MRDRFSAVRVGLVVVALVVAGVAYQAGRSSAVSQAGTTPGWIYTPIVPPPTAVTLTSGSQPFRVAVIGDSLSRSLYATTREQGWPELVQAAVAPHERGGVTLDFPTYVGDGRLFVTAARIATVPTGDNLIIIELGTNDTSTPLPDFVKSYRDVMKRARAGSPNAPMICLSTWRDPAQVTALDHLISEICPESKTKTADALYVQIDQFFNRKDTRGPEGRATFGGPADILHPNDLGHRLIAQRIIGALQY